MTKYEKLQNLLNKSIRKQNLRNSVHDLLARGKASTGSSSWISVRRGAHKEVWTDEVSAILTDLGIAHECGNDAPRGGANGEFVKITSPAFLKEVKAFQKRMQERFEAERKEALKKAAEIEAQRQAHRTRMNELVEENIDKFKSVDLVAIVKNHFPEISTLNLVVKVMTKNESKSVAREIEAATGLNNQLCTWFVRGSRFVDCITSQPNFF